MEDAPCKYSSDEKKIVLEHEWHGDSLLPMFEQREAK